MLERIHVAMLPGEAALIDADCFIVVDALRATTTIATLFSKGVREVWATNDLERARAEARDREALLIGEVNGLPPKGFDFGNSPVEIAHAGLSSHRAVMFTTNGTGALCAMAGYGDVFAGALTNASAVAAEAAAHYKRVALVCAGNHAGKRFALEDFVVAGALVARLVVLVPGAKLDDSAHLALQAGNGAAGVATHISQASHAASLRELGLEADIAFASEMDTMACAPMVVECSSSWARLIDGAGMSRDSPSRSRGSQ